MKCPYADPLVNSCRKAGLFPCVGVNDCVLINGNTLLQGIRPDYEVIAKENVTLKAEVERLTARVKELEDTFRARVDLGISTEYTEGEEVSEMIRILTASEALRTKEETK